MTGLDLAAVSEAFSIRLDGVFYAFVGDDIDDSIVVVHELGANRISFDGKTRWSISTDVIESFELREKRTLVLRLMVESKEIILDTTLGQTAG